MEVGASMIELFVFSIIFGLIALRLWLDIWNIVKDQTAILMKLEEERI